MIGAQTKLDAQAGRHLLQEEVYQYSDSWPAGLRGYLAALDDTADWPRVAAELEEFVPERLKDTPSVMNKPDYMVGLEWARRDLDAAIDWQPDNAPTFLLVGNHESAVNWLERNMDTGMATEEMAVQYGSSYARSLVGPDANIERLIGVLETESQRAALVQAFIGPFKESGTGRSVLRSSTDVLRPLVEDANLAVEDRERLLEIMEKTPFAGLH